MDTQNPSRGFFCVGKADSTSTDDISTVLCRPGDGSIVVHEFEEQRENVVKQSGESQSLCIKIDKSKLQLVLRARGTYLVDRVPKERWHDGVRIFVKVNKERITGSINASELPLLSELLGQTLPSLSKVPSFCHTFKSTRAVARCSQRTRILRNKMLETKSLRNSNHHVSRELGKRRKIKENLCLFPVSPKHCFRRELFDTFKCVFDGRPGHHVRPPSGCYPWNLVFSVNELSSDTSTKGSRLVPDGDDVNAVYKLLPRKQSIEFDFREFDFSSESSFKLWKNRIRRNNQLIDALDHAASLVGGVKRGEGKDLCFSGESAPIYCSLGHYGLRCGAGVAERNLPKLSPLNGLRIGKMVKNLEAKIREWLPTHILSGFQEAKELLGLRGMSVNEKDGHLKRTAEFFSSVAFGKNVFLSCHLDEDSFYSVVTIEKRVKEAPYGMEDPIIVYFCFPEYGVKVGLRPGDVLMFNPRVMHCVSSAVAESLEYYCISLYLKTVVVGKHDNSIEVTEEQLKFL